MDNFSQKGLCSRPVRKAGEKKKKSRRKEGAQKKTCIIALFFSCEKECACNFLFSKIRPSEKEEPQKSYKEEKKRAVKKKRPQKLDKKRGRAIKNKKKRQAGFEGAFSACLSCWPSGGGQNYRGACHKLQLW